MSSVVITLGHLMFSNFRSRFLWNESICFSAVFVSVHSALLYYRNIDVVYALKHFSFVLRLILFDLYIVWFLLGFYWVILVGLDRLRHTMLRNWLSQ